MVKIIGVEDFINLSAKIPIIDVRSPGEYLKGHIPGAYNIPLFNDKERSEVGTKYKKVNKEASVITGLEYVGPKLVNFVKQAKKIAKNNKLLVHCWRGGMRSESMAWLLSVADFETFVLNGGYRAYRQFFRKKLSDNKQKFIILSGMTGSGKTELLFELKKLGEQIIDLEGMAKHKGSAFGDLGQDPQPSTEQFTNNLFHIWNDLNVNKYVWIEDESKNIGTVSIPGELFNKMKKNPMVIIEMGKERRINRLADEYAKFDTDRLEKSILKIKKRLGGLRTKNCLDLIKGKKFASAINICLEYYDKAYLYGINKRKDNILATYQVNDKPMELIAKDIRQIVKKSEKF